MRSMHRRAGFTLVELLVVIGIIALLISMLLPALNKARQASNSVACGSNLRQIGALIQLYSTQNKGWLPPASITWGSSTAMTVGWMNPGTTATDTINPSGCSRGAAGNAAFWPDLLTLMARPVTVQDVQGTGGSGTGVYAGYNPFRCPNMAADFLPIFHDTDVPNSSFLPRVSNYYCNMRVIPPENAGDRFVPTAADGSTTFNHLQKTGDISRTSEVMMVWCAPALVNASGVLDINQYDSASWALDGSAYNNAGSAHCYGFPAPPTSTFVSYDNRIGLSSNYATYGASWATPPTKTALAASNVDETAANAGAHGMRFRHMNNKSVNALFVDGHAESRQLGDVKARDICLNWR